MAMTAPALLFNAASIMEERGRNYDQPGGERSMADTVAMFNILTGNKLTEEDGWEFMSLLKKKRKRTAKGPALKDSVEDDIAYTALAGEAWLRGQS